MSKQRPSTKRTSTATSSSSRASVVSRPKRGVSAQSRNVNAKGRKSLVARVDVIVSKPSKASLVGRQAERAFIAGVNRVLRNAQVHGTRVTVQGEDGRLVRGIPSRRGGAFVVVDEETGRAGKATKVAKRSSGQAHPSR